ncbi:MAG: DUF5110 domain-containing protein [Bacteroidales bacterium]|nr:DUF5110 domain-containing protein [Bacteroidales bacterium]MBN2820321.1 DUF5110 domain-containing protein [Bacteroidales bacterium]
MKKILNRPIKIIMLLLNLIIGGFCFSLISQERSALIGEGITIYYPNNYQSVFHEPSFALVQEPIEQGDLPEDRNISVAFDSIQGKSIATINVGEEVDFYGTGEVTGELLRNGKVRTLWNTDNYGYMRYHALQLYQSHPWVMGVRSDGTAIGVLADNTWKQRIVLDDKISFESEGPAFRVIVIQKKDPAELLHALADLTGHMPLPPLWSLGYQQCRWSYYPDSRVREIADTFRLKKIPCDVIWMDIHYMEGYRIFTFSEEYFPNPVGLNNYLHAKDFKSIWMIDPGVKYDEDYFIYKSGTDKDVWVKNAQGEDFVGDVWPGPCVFPDFTQQKTQKWWASQYKDYLATGIDGVWNDMNEPSVFNGPGWTMPVDNMHLGDEILPKASHERYHNVYGMLMVKSSREGILAAIPEKRPFILTRSNFLGGQRYAATWTGDNLAIWDHLKTSIPMVLNFGLSGQPCSGPDIGGFGGNATPELYGQWIATGVFYPFSRSHTAEGTNNQEPWAFGEEIEQVSRTAISRRYRLLPYLYTLFYKASQTGMPVMQPVFFADFKDESLRSEDEAFLLGSDLLIIPKWATEPSLPEGNWRTVSLVGEDSKNDAYQPEIKIREGAIVPLTSIIQNTTSYKLDTITLLVSLDEQEKARGELYYDEGEGFGYQEGMYKLFELKAEKNNDKLSVSVSGIQGKMEIAPFNIKVEWITDEPAKKSIASGEIVLDVNQ